MIMTEGLELPSKHAVLKMVGKFKGRDGAGVVNDETKMPATPSHFLPSSDQSGHHPCNRAFSSPVGGGQMQIDASRQVETPFQRSCDLRELIDVNYFIRRFTSAWEGAFSRA